MKKSISPEISFHEAVREGNIEIIKAYLSIGYDINQITKSQEIAKGQEIAPLHIAAKYGQIEAVKLLLKNNANINILNKYNETPLIFATKYAYRFAKLSKKHLDVIQFLIDNNAKTNISSTHYTRGRGKALDIAVYNCFPAIVKLLYPKTNINNRPCIVIPDGNNWHWNFSLWLETVMILKNFGYDFNKEWSDAKDTRRLLLDFFCVGKQSSSIEKVEEALNFILSHASKNLKLYAGNLLTNIVKLFRDIELFKMRLSNLLKVGLNIDARDKERGLNALHLAICEEKMDVIKVLIESGANINCKTNTGLTPLHLASTANKEITKLLLEKGANPEALDNQGRDPIAYSKFMCDDQVKIHYFAEPQYRKDFINSFENSQDIITEFKKTTSVNKKIGLFASNLPQDFKPQSLNKETKDNNTSQLNYF